MMGSLGRLGRRIGAVGAVVVALMAAMPAPASAQFGTLFGGSGSRENLTPPASIPGVSNGPPVRLAPPSQSLVPAQPSAPQGAIAVPPGQPQAAGQVSLAVNARFGKDPPQPITAGLTWRIYPAKPDLAHGLRPMKEEKAAAPVFTLPPGDYIVHVSFGLASAVKTVSLHADRTTEVFDLPAGGIRLEGRVADARIPPNQISFEVYPGSQFDPGERKPVATGVATGDVVVVPEGTYYIVSNYGDANATVRSDIRVQTGKLTDVVVSHRAAAITLKLVNQAGGEALANTQWTVITPAGDVIKEMAGAFPRIILAEGEYRAIARNEGHTYERGFKVVTGVDSEIEVLTR